MESIEMTATNQDFADFIIDLEFKVTDVANYTEKLYALPDLIEWATDYLAISPE